MRVRSVTGLTIVSLLTLLVIPHKIGLPMRLNWLQRFTARERGDPAPTERVESLAESREINARVRFYEESFPLLRDELAELAPRRVET